MVVVFVVFVVLLIIAVVIRRSRERKIVIEAVVISIPVAFNGVFSTFWSFATFLAAFAGRFRETWSRPRSTREPRRSTLAVALTFLRAKTIFSTAFAVAVVTVVVLVVFVPVSGVVIRFVSRGVRVGVALLVSLVTNGTVSGFMPARAAMCACLAEWLLASRFLSTW